jgi:hypothetical protein
MCATAKNHLNITPAKPSFRLEANPQVSHLDIIGLIFINHDTRSGEPLHRFHVPFYLLIMYVHCFRTRLTCHVQVMNEPWYESLRVCNQNFTRQNLVDRLRHIVDRPVSPIVQLHQDGVFLESLRLLGLL